MFTGSLRYNVDPLEECTDEQIWNALEKVERSTTYAVHAQNASFHIQCME